MSSSTFCEEAKRRRIFLKSDIRFFFFLMNRAVVENLSNVIYVFSNDVGCDEGFF